MLLQYSATTNGSREMALFIQSKEFDIGRAVFIHVTEKISLSLSFSFSFSFLHTHTYIHLPRTPIICVCSRSLPEERQFTTRHGRLSVWWCEYLFRYYIYNVFCTSVGIFSYNKRLRQHPINHASFKTLNTSGLTSLNRLAPPTLCA